MSNLLTLENLAALIALTALEIVLGIDNIVFIAIVSSKLRREDQHRARRLGLIFAMGTRVLLLLTLSWIMHLTQPLFSVFGKTFSGRDIVLFVGGLFLLGKATHEIHDKMESREDDADIARVPKSITSAVVQIAILDIVFSLDSVITAVGMAQHVSIMIAAIVCAVGVMLVFADAISDFIDKRPSIKILALSFLLLIGIMLVADSLGQHIPKGYIYFAMAFSLAVELLNLRVSSAVAKRKAKAQKEAAATKSGAAS